MKTVLVTGANRGIGRRLVERLLGEFQSYRVIATTRTEETGRKAMQDILALGEYSTRLLYHPLDITSKASIETLVTYLKTHGETLDVLVNNAGIAFKGPEFNQEVVTATLGTNFYATVDMTEAVIPTMKPGGHIIMVSSRAGLLSNIPSASLRERLSSPSLTLPELFSLSQSFISSVGSDTTEEEGWPKNSYRVSKNLLNAYIRCKARELHGRLRINGLCPGWVRTDMGGPNASLSLDEGTETPLAVIRDESDSSGQFYTNGQISSWS